MHEEEIKKLTQENFELEIKKSQAQESIYRMQARQQEINTRLNEILFDNYKVQMAANNINQLVDSAKLTTQSLKRGKKDGDGKS